MNNMTRFDAAILSLRTRGVRLGHGKESYKTIVKEADRLFPKVKTHFVAEKSR